MAVFIAGVRIWGLCRSFRPGGEDMGVAMWPFWVGYVADLGREAEDTGVVMW